jgi:hypothetical protein
VGWKPVFRFGPLALFSAPISFGKTHRRDVLQLLAVSGSRRAHFDRRVADRIPLGEFSFSRDFGPVAMSDMPISFAKTLNLIEMQLPDISFELGFPMLRRFWALFGLFGPRKPKQLCGRL